MSRFGRPEERAGRGGGKGSGHTKELSTALATAVESLCEATAVQRRCGEGVVNRGRIVCITSLSDERKLQSLLASVEERVAAANAELADSSSATALPLSTLDVDVVQCQLGPGHAAAVPATRGHVAAGPVLRYQVFCVEAGEALARRLLSMALNHYELASTTVTGIPMKEEQNASSSASYDVELFHRYEGGDQSAGGPWLGCLMIWDVSQSRLGSRKLQLRPISQGTLQI